MKIIKEKSCARIFLLVNILKYNLVDGYIRGEYKNNIWDNILTYTDYSTSGDLAGRAIFLRKKFKYLGNANLHTECLGFFKIKF